MASAPIGSARFSPIYLQLAKRLRSDILRGDFHAGDALPSERELCDMMGASRVTIRKSIAVLIAEGLLTRKQGSGTFVTPRIQAPSNFLSSFSEDAHGRGEAVDSIWIQRDLDIATAEEAAILNIAEHAPIARLSRVRMAAGEPLAIEHAAIPADMIGDLAKLGKSLYQALADGNNRPVSGVQKIRAARASATEAQFLTIAEGAAILKIERITKRADGRPVEYTRSAYRGDRFEFISDLRPEMPPL